MMASSDENWVLKRNGHLQAGRLYLLWLATIRFVE